MYKETITLFNLYTSKLGDVWYPTVIHNVYLLINRSAIIAKYGTDSKDSAELHIKYERRADGIYIAEKRYLPPREWDRQTNVTLSDTITFTGGSNFDFFIEGEHSDGTPISDDGETETLYQRMNKKYDNCFRISSAAIYRMIPHIEIMGA